MRMNKKKLPPRNKARLPRKAKKKFKRMDKIMKLHGSLMNVAFNAKLCGRSIVLMIDSAGGFAKFITLSRARWYVLKSIHAETFARLKVNSPGGNRPQNERRSFTSYF